MKYTCPTCGAEVEFRYDDSFVRVCGSCNSAVLRTDRGVETLGKFADLAPMSSALKVFADGHYGSLGFMLLGVAQIQHPAGGIWQEWYAKLDTGKWAWLSEAQGRLYMTFERHGVAVPPMSAMVPNAPVVIEGRTYYVGETGSATYVSARGEIPYKLVPRSSFYFADLSDGAGGFATIDYGDGSDDPAVYVGMQVTAEQLRITGGEDGPVTSAKQAASIKCPNCGGSLELRAPDTTLSVGCPYCNHLVSVQSGNAAIIGAQTRKPKLAIALGSKGSFPEGEFVAIGYVGRSAHVDGTWYPFEEYLLHSPKLGYRWLVNSDQHWSYVQPVATGAVRFEDTTYEGVKFTLFQRAALRVDYVLGELYWRAEVGEIVEAADFIHPPAMLSREYTRKEQNWSLATYMTPKQVNGAFGGKLALSPPVGVAPNQPYPGRVSLVIGLFTAALCAVGLVKCARSVEAVKYSEQFAIPAGSATPPAGTPPAEAGGHVRFSKVFPLDDKNVEIDVGANVDNNWAYFAVDLVNDKTGMLVSFDKNVEYYHGVTGGESWSEGSRSESEVLGPVEPGDYVVRVESLHGAKAPVLATVVVKQGVFRLRWFLVALGLLAIPFGGAIWHMHGFNKKRWENSNVGGSRFSFDDED